MVTMYVRNVKGAGKGPKGRVSPVPMSCVLRLFGRGHVGRVQRKVREISHTEGGGGLLLHKWLD